MEKIIDACGQVCPKPLIMTKKALTEAVSGDILKIIIDNETSKTNVLRFLKDNNVPTLFSEDNGIHTLLATVTKAPLTHPDAAGYCTSTAPKTPHVILVQGNTIGRGSDELGTVLVKGMLNTIKDVVPLPKAVVFINSGIDLACEGSPILETLKILESKSVAVMLCGTCVDYFGKKEKIRVGIISNAYDILTTLSNAGHVISL